MKKILVLGCTGSIGSQTLDLARKMPDRFRVVGLSVGRDKEKLDSLCKEFGCPGTCFSTDGNVGLKNLIDTVDFDMAVNGVAGSAGLESSVAVLESGADLALANKESVVMAWPIIKSIAKKSGAKIIPVDSEHSAVFNLINQVKKENLLNIIITASGGPFRTYTREQLESVTVEMALNHPTWKMGPKITIDSASLANKGLEVIEACRLFDTDPANVKVLVHPQSLVHSLVQTRDGMIYAQISNPDMRHPIFGALTWPENTESPLPLFDLAGHELTFSPPRTDDFPMLDLAYRCAEKNGGNTIAFNAANEIAVQGFFDRKIKFTQIPQLVDSVLDLDWTAEPKTVADVYEIDRLARDAAKNGLESIGDGK